jgi:hypothetical protein
MSDQSQIITERITRQAHADMTASPIKSISSKTPLNVTLGSVIAVLWTALTGAVGYIHGITTDHEKRIIVLEQKRTADDEQTKGTEIRRDRERTEILEALRRIEDHFDRRTP